MRWEDERYVRLYTRDTTDWLALSFDAQALFALLLRKVDRAGLLPLGKHGKRAVAIAIGHAGQWERLAPALEELLVDGCVAVTADENTLIIPNFLAAQEARASDKARQQKSRELARELAARQSVTKCDSASPPVTERHAESHTVTTGHARSRGVTPSCAEPCLAETKETTTPLSPPSPSAKGGAPGVRDTVANVVPLPPARRARADASALAVASASPPPDERDAAGLLPFESGAPPGEDLPSQLQAAFQGALGAPYRWDMRRDERAVNELLVAAGPDGRAEVLRRWRIGLANQGFPRVRSLSDLVKRWNDCAQPAGGGGKAGPPRASDGLAPSASDVCEGCGRAGEGARYGGGPDGHVFLGYGCGCGTAWTAELQRGRPYTEAPKWVREYRNRGAR